MITQERGPPRRSYGKFPRTTWKEIHYFAYALIFWRAQSANYIPNSPFEMYVFHVQAHSLMLMDMGSTCWVLFNWEVWMGAFPVTVKSSFSFRAMCYFFSCKPEGRQFHPCKIMEEKKWMMESKSSDNTRIR